MSLGDNENVIKLALELGFSACGFAPAIDIHDEIDKLKQWLTLGYNANMHYMNNNLDLKLDPRNLLPDAKTIIVLLKNYFPDNEAKPSAFKISRYAWGIDYHFWMKDKLNKFIYVLNNIYTNNKYIAYADSGPVMEKVWAKRAGLGWTGKHTLLINPEFGSWCFIGVVITTLKFDYSNHVPGNCGSCTACIDACPTGALSASGILDARKCISYLTVEKKGEFSESEKSYLNKSIFGCDICQEACPFNIVSKPNNDEAFKRSDALDFTSDDIEKLTQSQFKKMFAGSSLRRCGLTGLRRNIEALKH